MSIRDKLQRLDGAKEVVPEPVSTTHDDWLDEIQAELDIRVLQRQKSLLLLKETTFPLHPLPDFQELRDHDLQIPSISRILPEIDGDEINLRDIIFFDTETTGLAGGTGTYAFLIGLGHVELDHVIVRQYLLPDFLHEWLQLTHVDAAMSPFKFSASFNGKSFDLPLLRSRFRLNQMDSGLDDLLHLDLLHAARRLWRTRLPGCSLQSLEKHILGIERFGDIPGSVIPHIYYEFIRKRQTLMLRDVLEHNYHDVVNMVLLAIRMAHICRNPGQMLQDGRDQLALAQYDLRQGRYAQAVPLLQAVWRPEADYPGDLEIQAGFLLATCHKKNGDGEAARDVLEKLFDQRVLQPAVVETLAKYYEHEEKSFQSALTVVETGISYLEMRQVLERENTAEKALKSLKHRRSRLRRKIDRQENPST